MLQALTWAGTLICFGPYFWAIRFSHSTTVRLAVSIAFAAGFVWVMILGHMGTIWASVVVVAAVAIGVWPAGRGSGRSAGEPTRPGA